MTKISKTVLFVSLFLTVLAAAPHIHDYKVDFCACSLHADTNLYIGLRSFTWDTKPEMLVVDPIDLTTRIVSKDSVRCKDIPLQKLDSMYKSSAYVLALDSAEKNRRSIQDAGLQHGDFRQKGIDLTADLCPTKHALDRSFFMKLVETFGDAQRPIPIALSITGKWMENHARDLLWLKELEKNGYFSFTWINHTYNHRVAKDVPLRQNFILEKGTDLDSEVLKTEKKMIENNMTPSVFFRFPGLVSDSLVFTKITGYGLIPVGTDAWLAKNEKPSDGSIVLVHANGNEPYGIGRFYKLVADHKDAIRAGTWLLFDLRKSIIDENALDAKDSVDRNY